MCFFRVKLPDRKRSTLTSFFLKDCKRTRAVPVSIALIAQPSLLLVQQEIFDTLGISAFGILFWIHYGIIQSGVNKDSQ